MGILAKVFLGKLNRYQASGRFLEEPALIAIRCKSKTNSASDNQNYHDQKNDPGPHDF